MGETPSRGAGLSWQQSWPHAHEQHTRANPAAVLLAQGIDVRFDVQKMGKQQKCDVPYEKRLRIHSRAWDYWIKKVWDKEA